MLIIWTVGRFIALLFSLIAVNNEQWDLATYCMTIVILATIYIEKDDD